MNPDEGVADHLGLTGGNEATSSDRGRDLLGKYPQLCSQP
jgi:hypothetical protein